tara:strand:+ start:2865 stop:3521 length:657 start_codon:yes stop_codon:yes gene_type:complete
MNEVVNFFENLSDKQREHLIHSPTIRDAFSADLADDFDLSQDEIRNMLEELIEDMHPADSFKIPQLRLQKKRVSWDKGESFKIKEKKAQLMNKFLELLQNDNGLSKTSMLKVIKKDNPLWRNLANDVLEYMVDRDLIIKISNRYYLTDTLLEKENTFHRKVYDYICKGPITISTLLFNLNYRNPKGKSKLLSVLSLMENEGMIYKEGNKWVLRNNITI